MIRRQISKVRHGFQSPARQRGQSLVELAIVVPILLVLLLGLAEVGAALYSYQIVVNAAREGARYGAKSQYTPDEHVAAWARQSAGSLPITVYEGEISHLDGEKATIIVTRLRKVYSEEVYDYEVIETYSEGGDRSTILTDEWFTAQEEKSGELEWPAGVINQAMDMIAVEVMYDHPHLTGFFDLGNPIMDLVGIDNPIPNPVPMHAVTVMRIGGSRIPSCDVYPIGVPEDALEGLEEGDVWEDIFGGGGPGQFGWLCWPDHQGGDADYLADMLTDPGTSRRDFDNATDPDDHWLNTGDDVHANTGVSNSDAIRDAMEELVGKKIRLPVWDYFNDDPDYYHISGFVWVEIVAFDLPGQGGWIRAVFRGWDDTCTDAD